MKILAHEGKVSVTYRADPVEVTIGDASEVLDAWKASEAGRWITNNVRNAKVTIETDFLKVHIYLDLSESDATFYLLRFR
jgi:hypothetical protein